MKSKTAVFLVIGLIVTLVTFAQTSVTASNNPTFSEQEKVAAKQELQKVGELFGVKKQGNPPAPVKAEDKPVTMAEVADKALNMVGNAVGTIAGIVQKVAPEVWEIMVRQQYAAALATLIGPFLFLLINGIYVLVVKKYWKKYPDDKDYLDHDDEPTLKLLRAVVTSIIPGILAIVFTGVLAYRIGDALPMLINPKYYAVRDLLQMLLQ